MNHELDLTGYNCPLPVLKTKKFLAVIEVGDIVRVITTDPASKDDLADFCIKTGHILLEQFEQKNTVFTIIKKNQLLNKV